ncbi:hypothetical protein T07_7613 [Trichinella nelsoni]|uniref:Uncharacterized protein n=1 Tax=Trichinella nelsoni TaxID=6336 RepID=A0A0V0S846_9BILA|nr:hypothetical protein T07_7613 [Trichinella nelsoni]
MLDYRVEMGVTLKDHLLTETDRKLYASNTIQNDSHFCSQEICEKIVLSLRRARFLTVIADETKDSSGAEQLCLCLRFVENSIVREEFIAYLEMIDLSGGGIAKMILEKIT